MGNGASLKPEIYASLKEEYEKNKGNMTDDEMFQHMKIMHDKLAEEAKTPAQVHDIIAIAGPDTFGKANLVSSLLEKFPGKMDAIICHSDRELRQGESEGRPYYFLSKDEMKKRISESAFVQNATVNGNTYAVSFDEIKRICTGGKIGLISLHYEGVQELGAQSGISCHSIFMVPSSVADLEKLLNDRYSEAPEKLEKALADLANSISIGTTSGNFDFILNPGEREKLVELLKTWYPHL